MAKNPELGFSQFSIHFSSSILPKQPLPIALLKHVLVIKIVGILAS